MSEDEFEDYLNECKDDVVLFGYTFPAGWALRKLDPIAFREAFLDHLDYDGLEETE